jgi:hypothetical protein
MCGRVCVVNHSYSVHSRSSTNDSPYSCSPSPLLPPSSTPLCVQLSIYVDCRAAFSNLETVMERIVLCVARLAIRAHQLMRGKHSRKTAGFVKVRESTKCTMVFNLYSIQ